MLPIIYSSHFFHEPLSEVFIYLLFYLYILCGSYIFVYNYFREVGDDNNNDNSSDIISPYPKVEYTDKYDITSLIEKNDLDHKDDLDIKRLDDCVILENTPIGMIYMIYKNNEFGYYSNTNVNYNILDTVCRKFVKTFQCVSLYNKLEEVDKNKDNKDNNDAPTNSDTNSDTNNKRKKSHLFATFKKNNAPKTVKKNMNVFRKLGSLQEFKILKNTFQKKGNIKNITFADFKNMK